MIILSYSRISFADVSAKLRLENAADAESICAKAIRDGVIEASIDHGGGFLRSRETADVYSTKAPFQAFHERISFCLDVHNEAVKAMRYPEDAFNRDVDDEKKDLEEEKEAQAAKEEAEEEEREEEKEEEGKK
jgi:26S proteasome regulatory subunit N3